MGHKKSLIDTFKTFLHQQNLEGAKLLLMVSGGVDSVVLLHVAAQVVEAKKLAVFHLNHNVRPESQQDLIFVQNICTKLKVKFYPFSLPPLEGTGASLEKKWRTERIKLSQQAAIEFGATKILTAHHATDLVETMIFRLTKGCGPNGLAPFDISTKPFWQIPKQDLIDYAHTNQLEWQEDESNLNKNFERNLIRHEVLPALRKITPNLEKVFVREAKTFSQVSDFLSTALSSPSWGKLEGSWITIALKNKSIPLAQFLELAPILQTETLRHLSQTTPSQSELEDCLKWLQGHPAGKSEKMLGGTKLQIAGKNFNW